ncbi:hypothetical protein D3C72_837540 [compost metagenome]
MDNVQQFFIRRTLKTHNKLPDVFLVIFTSIILIQQPSFLLHIADQLFHLHADQTAFRTQLINEPFNFKLNADNHFNPLNYINNLRQSDKLLEFRGSQIRKRLI